MEIVYICYLHGCIKYQGYWCSSIHGCTYEIHLSVGDVRLVSLGSLIEMSKVVLRSEYSAKLPVTFYSKSAPTQRPS